MLGFLEKSGEILAKCWDFLKKVGKFLQNVGIFGRKIWWGFLTDRVGIFNQDLPATLLLITIMWSTKQKVKAYSHRICIWNDYFIFQLSNDEEKAAFVDDYRITACISILQWFCMEYKKLGTAGVESFEAKARRSVVEFSLLRYSKWNNYFL